MNRKPIQVSVTQCFDPELESVYGEAIAVCDDGSMWRMFFSDDAPMTDRGIWERLPDIPQEDD